MKILWITNIIFPEVYGLMEGKTNNVCSGGWMIGAARALLSFPEVELIVASPTNKVIKLTELHGEKICYLLFPLGKGNLKKNNDYCKYWREICDSFCPDIVHIHGTEYSHGLAYVDECGSQNVVVSVQGLTSVISRYYTAGISFRDIMKNYTFHDFLRGGIYKGQRLFMRRGRFELELLKKVNDIIGRTNWDKAHLTVVNSKAKYHFCNETLREVFYEGQWNYSTCQPHSIFLSQANYPLKGCHQVLKALPFILREFPDTQVKIAGGNILQNNSFFQKMRRSGYAKYLTSLIEKNKLDNHIVFLGALNANDMKKEYLNCNVFVCPSSIENSSNSIGEAQILGVPCVASYVGGTPDIMFENKEYLYRFEEVEMMANLICRIFRQEGNVNTSLMREEAIRRHNPTHNARVLLQIYQDISRNE